VSDMGRSDAELLEASRRGEREAFGALIERYQAVVCAVSFSRTGDRALSEDVAQDTFIAAWSQLDRLREPRRLRAWLCRIARNLARKARRRTAREAPLERIVVFEGSNPFDQAAEAESERVVRDALARVPENYRDVLVLYYRDQRSVRDVAAQLGITEAAALQRLARGRQYLADGVTDLVERSLRASPMKRSLAAVVLAALPAVAPSRVEVATHSHGGTMFKLAIAAGVVTAIGTTAYVVRQPGAPPVAAAASAEPTVRAAVAPAPAAKPTISTPTPARVAPALPAPAVDERRRAPAPDDEPVMGRADMEKMGLLRGPARGPADAPVTIVVFTDLLCPHCGNALGTFDQLWDEYPNKLRMVVKQLPVHATAVLPAEATLAAEAQGKFWEMYNLIHANQDSVDRDGLIALAERAGLDVAAFSSALDRHTYAAAVDADKAAALKLELQATPAFLINGRRVVGNLSVDVFRKIIDQALADR